MTPTPVTDFLRTSGLLTPVGEQALADATNDRERAKLYFAGMMQDCSNHELSMAILVVRALEGGEVAIPALGWLNVCRKSFDTERALMATVALRVIVEEEVGL